MSIILTCLLILFVLFVYLKIIKPGLYWQTRGVVHIKPWTRFVSVFLTRKSFNELIQDAYNEFPNLRYFGSYQFMTPSLFVRDVDLIKQITVRDFDHFTDHVSFITEKSDPLMGVNLFSLRGERWKHMRSTLSPAFTSSKMKSMFILISDTAENFVNHFLEQNKDVIELEMKDAFGRYTNDVIATCAFGIKCNSLRDGDNDFYRMGKEAMNFGGLRAVKNLMNVLFPKVFEFFRIPILPGFVSTFFRRVVKDTITVREQNGIIRPDMIHLLMEAKKGKLIDDTQQKTDNESFAETIEFANTTPNKGLRKHELSDNDIAAQALVFFLAGFETASTVMSFLSYELALQPEIQRKLQAEIDDTLEKLAGKITYEEIQKMKYLDQVVSEALRKWPPGFALSRICVKDYMIEPKGGEKPQLVEKDCFVLIPVYGIHRDPKYFPNPERFDPERFSDENKSNIVPGSFLSFGIGPRNCIGSRFALLEMKTLIFHLFAKFDVVVVKKTAVPLRLAKTLNISSKDGFWLGLKQRTF